MDLDYNNFKLTNQVARNAGSIFRSHLVSGIYSWLLAPSNGVTVYFIPCIFYPGENIYYPADSISLVYFIPRQDILSLHGDRGMSQNISVATQSSSPAVSQCSLNSSYGMYCPRGEI